MTSIAWAVMYPNDTFALPAGGVVAAGNAVIESSAPNTVQINQTSAKAIVNWESYNVAQHEQVNYHQPSSSSITLNRINPNSGVSQIYGSINANGQVWLVNPAGLWFGPNSRVNVGGLVATTADISNADFMAGQYNFVQSTGWNGAVINEGYITVMNHGLAALVGPGAVNKGQITANLGTVVLGAGQRFTIDFAGDSLLNFTISGEVTKFATDQNGQPLKHVVENSGTITANGGKIQMTANAAAGVLDEAINMKGFAVANSVSVKNGEIILSAGDGRVTVTGTIQTAGNKRNETGGTIKILGNEVVLAGHAVVDASGKAGGGTILIGGNAYGAGPEQNAAYAFLGRDVNIYADARELGKGGKVVLWSDIGTHFYGNIFARGGIDGGDGGWVETSGKAFLNANGLVTASAPHGANGSWLLDPYNVAIVGATANGAFDGGSPNTFTPTADTATVNAATINASLDAGTSVVITTGAGGAQAGTITVSSAITKSSGATTPQLTLNAAGAIAINAAIGFTSGGLDLVLISGGAITQTAALTVSSLSANAGANAITLTNAGNDFSGAVSLNNTGANAVAIRDANALQFGTSTIGGALTVTAAGAVTQSGAMAVTGVTTVAAGVGNNVTLNNVSNDFSTFGVTTGLDVTVSDANALILGTTTASGLMNITTNGAITQSGTVIATGAATFNAGAANNITLATATNNFSTLSVTSANNVSLANTNAIILGASTIGGTLGVTTAGAITQSGALSVTGAITLAAGAANSITLNDAGNDFSSLGVTTGLNVAVTDANALALAVSTISGTLGVTTNGAITQTGALTITGVTTLAAGAANDITLATLTNNFSTVSITSGNNVTLRDSGAIILGASTAATSLGVIAGGAITQSGVLTSPTLTAKTLGTNLAITLNTSINEVDALDLRSRNAGDTADSGGAIAYRDATGFNIANMIATTSTVTLTAGDAITQSSGAGTGIFGTTLTAKTLNNTGAAITLANALNALTTIDLRARDAADTANAAGAIDYRDVDGLAVAAANTTSTVTLTAGGAMTQTAAMTGTTLTAKTLLDIGAAITLNLAAGNAFTTINLLARNAADTVNAAGAIAYRSVSGFDVSGIATTSTLSLQNNNTPTNSPMTQSGAIVAGVTTLIGGATNDITFNHIGNDFGTVATTSGLNVALTDANALILGASTVSGTLGVTTSGAMTQSGALTVTGLTTLAAGSGNNITLNSANNFSTLGITSGNNVALTDSSGIILDASTVSGTLGVTTNGAITQSGALSVSGVTTLAAGAANSITLNNVSNDFSTVGVTTGANVALTDVNSLILGASTVSGTYGVTTSGAITQSGVLTITGVATLAAGAANDITLNSANNFSTIGFTNGNNVAFTDSNAVILGASTISGTLGVIAVGAVTQSGALVVTGDATIAAGAANSITLNNAGNNFNSVGITSALNVALTDSNALNLAASTIAGTLGVTTSGAITQTGALAVTGSTTLAAGAANSITLNDSANNFSTVAITNGLNVALSDVNALILATSTVSGTLDVNTSGAITQSGSLAVTGAATLAAGAANNITLTAANNFSTLGIASGNNVLITDANALNFAASTLSGTLGVSASGAITQSGALSVAGVTTLAVGVVNDITLNNASNDFGAISISTGLNVGVTDANSLILGTSNVSGNYGVTTNGAITQSGALIVTGVATFAAGAANDITLTTATNNFNIVSTTSANNVVLRESGPLTIGATNVANSFTVTAGSTVTQSGVIEVPNLTVKTLLDFGAGIILNTSLNKVDNIDLRARNTADTGNAAGAISYQDENGFNIANSLATISTISLIAGGDVTQNSGAGTGIFGSTLTVLTKNNSGGAVTLSNSLNNVTTIDLRSRNAADSANAAGALAYTDLNVVTVAAANTTSTVDLIARNTITQSGTMTGTTLTAKTLLDGGAAISLNIAAGNEFNTINLLARNTADTANAAGAISYRDATGFDVAGIATTSTLSLQNNNTPTNSPITQSGAIVAGVTTLIGGATNDITLNNSGNDFGTVATTSGLNVALTDANALILGTSTVSGTLDVNTTGALTQSGALTVTGVTTLAAGAANNITLNSANNFSTIGITSGNNVGITDANALILAASTVSGTLGVTTNGAMTQSGALSVAGVTTLAAGAANSITLNNASNDFSTVGITTGLNVGLTDANSLILGTSTVSGTYGVTTSGAITQSGALTITGVATLAAGSANNITLNSANNFSTIAFTSGNNVAFTDSSGVILGASTVSGTLGVTANGAITQSGALSVVGTTTLAAGAANSITLTNVANNFSIVGVTTGLNVALTDANSLDLAASTISGTLGVTTSGAITQSGALSVTGVTTLTAGATNNITLNNLTNNFSTVGITTGLNVSLTDANALILGASTVSGTFDVSTTGAITQSGVLTVTGVTMLAAGAANNITLNSANNFSTIGITSGNNVFIVDSNALNFAGSTVSGFLGVSTSGTITQTGALNVSGITTLAAGAANNITLNNAANNFSTVGITSGLNVGLTDANSLILGTSTVSGTYGVTTSGAITQSGALTVTGVTTLAAGTANNITLTTATNNFSTVSTTSGNNVALRDSGAIVIGATTAASSLTVTAGGAITQSGIIDTSTLTAKTLGTNLAITLNSSINKVNTIDLRARNAADTANSGGAIAYQDEDGFNIGNSIATTSTISLIAGGNVTQNTGAGTGIFGTTLTVLTKNNSGGAITLTNALNAVATIDFRARNAANSANAAGALAYTDLNAVAIAAANTTSTVGLIAGGAITQTGTMMGSTLSAKTLLNAGAAITLNIAAGNEFNAINLLARNTADTANAAGAISYRDATGFDVAGIATTSTLSLQNNNTPTNSPITQSGAIVAGVTTLIGGATNDITLNNAGNDFGTVATTSGLNVALTDANALILGASTVSGTLNVNTSGAITQSGVLTVTGVTTLAAGSANNITLNSANNFSTIGITSGNNIGITDASALILAASTVSGTLGVTTNGAMTQSGALSVAGVTTLAAGAANNITLNNISNDFSTVGITTALNVGLTDANSLILGTSTVSGTYGVTTSGAITQSGLLTITGVATLAAGSANDITLNSANNFSTIGFISGHNVAFTDSSGVILGASTVSGTLGVTANGAITQSGVLSVTGLTTLAAGAANSITLNTAGNDFSTVGITSGLNVGLTDTNALILAASTVSGTLGVTTSGAITQSGALTVAGVATLAAGAANNITLNTLTNNFSTVGITTGLNVALTDANALILAASTVSGTLDVNTSGAITQSGVLTVTGVTTLAAGSANNITLNSANNFSTIGITSGNNVGITDANALILAASTVSGTLGVTTNGAMTQSGALSVAGIATLAAGATNNITLNNISNDFSTVGITTALNVDLTDANSLILGTSTVSGTYGVTTSGAITQSGVLTITGVTTLAAGAANDITLANASNNFSTVSITNGNTVSLRDSGAIILGASTAATSLGVIAAGAITQSGVLTSPTLTAKTLGTNLAITLNTSINEVDNLDLRSRNAGDTANSGGAIAYRDATGFNIANTIATTSTVTLTAGDAITQSSGAGTGIFGSTLTAKTLNNSGAAITLANALNALTTVDLRTRNAADTANVAGAIDYRDVDGFAVSAANTTSTVTLTAGGAITQTGTMTGSTLSAKTLLNTGAAITLNIAAGNEFNAINLLARNTTDTANAAGAISYRDATGFDVAGIATTSTLSLQNNNTPTNSPITQSGAIVAGVTTLIGGATNDITLNNAGNDFSTVAITSGLNVALTDANALILGASTVSGTLNINTSGAITQSAALSVTGLTTLAAGAANNITLSNAGNNFSAVGIISGNNVGITDANALILAASTVSGTLGVTTTGALTQSGALSVTGVTQLLAGAANNITLNDVGNNFSTVGITSGLNVALTDANSLILGASTVSGTYGVTTNGAITQSGVLTVTGVATLAAGAANNITLNSANNFSTIGFTSGNNVAFTDANSVILGASTVSGTLGVTANGAMTQSGALSVAGATTLAAGAANNITLNNAGNDFSGVGITSGLNVSLTDANALSLAASTVSGGMTVVTGGALSQSGALTVNGVGGLSVTSVGGAVLTNNGNQIAVFNGDNSSSGNIELTTTVPLTIASLNQAGGGSVVLVGSGSIQVPNGVTINTGNGALSITASDLNLNATGALNSGTADTTITANAGTVGVGLAVGSMSISNAELQRMTAANLIINGLNNVTLQVDGVALADTSNIANAVTFGSQALNSTVTFANNASLFKSLNVIADSNVFVNVLIGTTVGDLTVTGPLQLNIPSVTTAGAQIYNGAVQLGSNVNLNAGGNIIFGGTLDSLGSMRNLTLNAGASGDISFVGPVGSVMRLGDLTIANVNNTSNAALMKVNSFIQSAGGTTTLGAFGLDALGMATVMASSITGKVAVQGLTLNTQTAYLNGTVAGLSGQLAINQIILLNTILPGTHYFDGIDMYPSTPPNPVVTGTVPSPAQVFASYLSSSANVISPTQGLSEDISGYNAVSGQELVLGCLVITPSIKVCKFPRVAL